MKLAIMTLSLAIWAALSFGQEGSVNFKGLQKVRYIAKEGVEFRRPVISPDGRWIAFSSNAPAYALWIARSNDLRPRLLVEREGLGEIRRSVWSPDSQQIAYVDERTVKLIDVVTRKVVSKSLVSPFMSDPVFDAEGNLLVVGNTDLIGNKVALEGDLELVKALTPNDGPYLVAIGRGGKVFSDQEGERRFDGPDVIVPYILSLGDRLEAYLRIGSQDRKITPATVGDFPAKCFEVLLSPNREKVVIYCIQTKSRLSVYEISTGKYYYDLGRNIDPRCWSPDSEWVLCAAEIGDGHAVDWNDLYVVHYTGSKRLKIARAKGTVYGASWGKNGLIAYDEEGKIVIGKLVLK
ncbi:MAG: hypothetical protein NZ823_17870 [Blastocatellia bacterium]|nr:hypothetical protein [Blastocatellia bacterium]